MVFIAYFALAAAIACLVKYIKASREYSSWKKKELITGVIGEETRRMPFNGGMKYIYHFTLNASPEPINTTYEDIVNANEVPTVKVGDIVEVYYDPVVKYYRDKAKISKGYKKYLFGFIGCFVLSFILHGLRVLLLYYV